MRRMRRFVRAGSGFLTQLGAALIKTILTSLVVCFVVVSIMHYMGVPVPNPIDLLRGVIRFVRLT
jgi:hypothetical protein